MNNIADIIKIEIANNISGMVSKYQKPYNFDLNNIRCHQCLRYIAQSPYDTLIIFMFNCKECGENILYFCCRDKHNHIHNLYCCDCTMCDVD